MNKKIISAALFSASFLPATLIADANAQLLYKSYDYSTREQYQTMQPSPPPPSAAPSPVQHSYTPDPILSPATNQRLAQGDPQPTRYTPPSRPPAASVLSLPVNTVSGFDLGIQVSDYRYQEHIVPTTTLDRLTGANFGGTAGATMAYADGWFWNADLRAAYGQVDYAGGDINLNTHVITPSQHDAEDNWLVDTHIVGGHDFTFGNGGAAIYDISPYAGLGFRYVYNDGRGNDTNKVSGYQRESHYLYFPVGVTQRLRVIEDQRVALNFEFDDLLYGWQTSSLGDAIPGAGDITNSQGSGYGLRGSLMYEWPRWALGPFFNYWNINQSDSACNTVICGVEPHNQTIEYGLNLKYRFGAY